MSKYLNPRFGTFDAYVPGEQPRDRQYIKLNTNENPFPPSPFAQRLARQAAAELQLYSDPEVKALASVAAQRLGVKEENLIFTNGSDEILYFAFLAFCGEDTPAVFPDLTYGFYPVFARACGVDYQEIPLSENWEVIPGDYAGADGTIFLANPNAPTGIALSSDQIEKILIANPDRVVVVDEAYVDFGGETVVSLIQTYDRLLVTRTFSKSYSLAGARLGIGIASEGLIADLKKIKYSVNPYNVNAMTAAAGVGALLDREYFEKNVETIKENRAYLAAALQDRGFCVLPSETNFLFVKKPGISGGELYRGFKERGVLVRYFDLARTKDFVRISIGTKDELDFLIRALDQITEAQK